jgi:MSHA biogenesis protein MshJ
MSDSAVTKMRQRFEALSERERLLLFAALLMVCWGLAEVLFLGRLRTRHNTEAQQVQALRDQVGTLSAQQAELSAQVENGPLQAAQAQEQELLERIAKADLALRGENVRYLDAARARQVLHQLLAGTGLHLVSMRALPAEIALSTRSPAPAADTPDAPADADGATTADDPAAAAPAPAAAPEPGIGLDLYRHPIEVQLEGSFADMVEYLSRLERSDWSLMWHELDIQTIEYPRARLRFVVYTFSLEEAWIGV